MARSNTAPERLTVGWSMVRGYEPPLGLTSRALFALLGTGDPARTKDPFSAFGYGHPRKAIIQELEAHITRARPAVEVLVATHPTDFEELKLDKATPQPFRLHAHHWLILHGRYVCKARTPECWRCIVRDLCAFKPKTPPPKQRGSVSGPCR